MATTEVSTIQLNEVPRQRYGAFVSVVRAGLYSLIVLGTAVGAGVYGLRTYGIFGCSASGYSSSRTSATATQRVTVTTTTVLSGLAWSRRQRRRGKCSGLFVGQ